MKETFSTTIKCPHRSKNGRCGTVDPVVNGDDNVSLNIKDLML
jgi:hypothetical protein